jgi:hypothetical protein
MAKIHGFFRSLIVWTHERGTLQYDIICALILLFIFLVPRGCFSPKRPDAAKPAPVHKTTQSHP